MNPASAGSMWSDEGRSSNRLGGTLLTRWSHTVRTLVLLTGTRRSSKVEFRSPQKQKDRLGPQDPFSPNLATGAHGRRHTPIFRTVKMPPGSFEAMQSVCALNEEKNSLPAEIVHPLIPPSDGPRPSEGARMRESSLSARPFLFSSARAWVALDFVLAVAVRTIAQAGHAGLPRSIHSLYLSALVSLPFAFFVVASSRMSGLYRMNANHSTFLDLLRVLRAVTIAGLILFGLHRLWEDPGAGGRTDCQRDISDRGFDVRVPDAVAPAQR